MAKQATTSIIIENKNKPIKRKLEIEEQLVGKTLLEELLEIFESTTPKCKNNLEDNLSKLIYGGSKRKFKKIPRTH